MLSNYFIAFGLVIIAGLSSALIVENPEASVSLFKRVVSPDETCGNVSNGNNKGYSCDATVDEGGCCVSCQVMIVFLVFLLTDSRVNSDFVATV